MQIKHIETADCLVIAKIHANSFQGFFLTSLGIPFLSAYYKAVVKNKMAIALCVVEDKEIVGFAVGTLHSKSFHKMLLINNISSFLWQGVRLFFTKPHAIWRLMQNMNKNASALDDGNYAELLSIGVLNKDKGSGVGRELSSAFECAVREKGASILTLTTDVRQNEDVLAFYRKMGYTLFYEFTAFPHRPMYKLIKQL